MDSEIRAPLDDFTHAVKEALTAIKTDEAHVAEVAARTERRKKDLAKLLRSTCSDVRKILTAA